MNTSFERLVSDLHYIRIVQKENKDKDKDKKKTPSLKYIKENESIENFMKFQWSWTL